MPHKTKTAMKETFKKLLEKKPIEKIKIKDITSECGVNRMTFYYHFKDIYDLVEWSLFEDAKSTLGGNIAFSTWQEGYLKLLEAVKQNKSFVTNVYRSIDRARSEDFIKELMSYLSINTIDKNAAESIPESEIEFISDFYDYALTATMIKWIQSGMKEEPEYIVYRADILITKGTNGISEIINDKSKTK